MQYKKLVVDTDANFDVAVKVEYAEGDVKIEKTLIIPRLTKVEDAEKLISDSAPVEEMAVKVTEEQEKTDKLAEAQILIDALKADAAIKTIEVIAK